MPDTQGVDESTYEIVVFGLVEGAGNDALIETSKQVSQWVQTQPGFIDRKLIRTTDGKYADILRWNSTEQAASAADLAESSPQCAPMFALIDMESVSIFHGSVIHQTTAGVAVG